MPSLPTGTVTSSSPTSKALPRSFSGSATAGMRRSSKNNGVSSARHSRKAMGWRSTPKGIPSWWRSLGPVMQWRQR